MASSKPDPDDGGERRVEDTLNRIRAALQRDELSVIDTAPAGGGDPYNSGVYPRPASSRRDHWGSKRR